MEYTNDLTIFEGIVDSADDVISIAEIKEKAGNERRIDYLKGCIRKFLKEVEYLEDGQYKKEVYDKLRQLALFIIFSTELPVLEEMKEWQGLELIIGSLPTLPKYVLCEILWNLDIDEIICEILIYTYPILALDVADSLIENFKYFVPDNCLEKLHMLTGSCYKFLYQLMFFNLNNKVVIRTYNNFMLCLKYFLEPPNSYKLDTLSEDDLYEYLGNRIYAFLGVLDECFNVFTRKGLQKLEVNEIYLSTMPPNIVKRECVSLNDADKDSDINLINDHLVKCNMALLDTCRSLLTDISIDIFCSWSEFEKNGISLQNAIGDLGYKLTTKFYQFVNNIEPVWVMLQLISSKPKDLKEEINKVDSITIVENISKGTEESIEWLKALVHRDNLCSDYDLLREIYNQSNVMSNDESHKLYNILYDHLEGLGDNREFIKSLLIRCFENCMNEVKQELVEKHFCQNLNDTLTSEIFDSMMTKIFNKLISLPEADEIFEQIYDVFLQSPKKVYNKIFLLASESIQQAKIMVKVMMFLNKYSNHKYDNENECCVLLMAKDTLYNNDFDTEIQRDNFITFIEKLKYTKVLAESKLLNFVIMPSLLIGLTSNDISKLCLHCKLLQKAYTPTDIVQYRAPFLVMLAQVLETVRWRINTFTSMKLTVLDLVLDLVSSIFNTYDSDIPEKDSEWLKMKLKNLHPLNMYYYRNLWKPKGNSFIEIISGTHIHEEIHHERLIIWLTQQFCSTSLQEWFKMWDSLEIFKNTTILDLFHAAIMIIVVTENNHRTEHSEACLLYCLRNYISIIKNKYLKPPLNDFAVKNVTSKLAALENLISVSNIEEIKTIFLPLFSFIAERKEDYAVDTLVSLHNQFKHTEIKDACVRFFINSNTDE